MSGRDFAYGHNVCNGSECPAETVGETDEENVPRGPAGTYDSLARNFNSYTFGVIDEEKAKELWFEAILKELERYHTRNVIGGELRRAREGVKIAKELGWL